MNEPRVRPSVSGVEPSPVCAGEGEGGGRMREIVSACVRVSPRRRDGGRRRNGDDGPNEWLVSRRRDAKGEVGRVISLPVVSCSLSEVRSGRFEGRGLGVLSRLETGRRGNGRSGQRVGDRQTVTAGSEHCLPTAADGRATVLYLRVQLRCWCRCQIEIGGR